MQPVSDVINPAENNVIYIESDDQVESVNESQNIDGADEQSRVMERNQGKQMLEAKPLLYGDTGTTQPIAGSAQQLAAMTMLQNPAPDQDS